MFLKAFRDKGEKARTRTVRSTDEWEFDIGDRVRKRHGSSWRGCVVGFYTSSVTTEGYCVESEWEPGSVQIYPWGALERIPAAS